MVVCLTASLRFLARTTLILIEIAELQQTVLVMAPDVEFPTSRRLQSHVLSALDERLLKLSGRRF